MKTNLILAGLIICSTRLFAQVEHDDMYFKKEDRINLKLQTEQADDPINFNNKVDDQLAHSINPEYLSQIVNNGEGSDKVDGYYISNYRYNSNFDPNFINLNVASIYGSSWYYDMYFSPYFNPWRNPYQNVFMYDQFYNPYRNRWMNPYYSNGWYNVSLMSCFVSPSSWSWNQAMSMPFNVYPNGPYSSMTTMSGFYNNQTQSVNNSQKQLANVAQTAARNSRAFDATRNGVASNSKIPRTRKTRTAQVAYYTPQWRRPEQQTSDNIATTGNYPKSRMSNTENRSSTFSRSGGTLSSKQHSTSSSAQKSSTTSRSSSTGGGSSSRSSRGSN